MSSERYIVFPHQLLGGLTNMLMEIEIRVILANLANRTLVSLNKFPCSPQDEDHLFGRYREAAMLDLFDLPVKHISVTKMYKRGFKEAFILPWQGSCASEAYFKFPSNHDFSDNLEKDFMDDRKFCWEFPNNDADAWIARWQKRTFSNSTYFFLVSDSYKRKIRSIVNKIQPKAVYFNLAKKIAKDLGDFNGIHVRLGDFKQWWIKSPTAKEITQNISSVMASEKPLVICTDNSNDKVFFAPIMKAFPKHIFIDEYIVSEYKKDLDGLPFRDASVIALLSSLVTSDSKVFAGSIYSTFTSSIHRRRLFKNPDLPILFTSNPFDEKVKMVDCEFQSSREGHFSWNRLNLPNPETARANSWLREWPETIK
jgi:hypothetical protein